MVESQNEPITERDANLGKHTRVTLPVLIAALGLAISSGIEYSSLKADIADLKKSQWTINDQLQWCLEVKSLNPGISMPIPTFPGSPFSVIPSEIKTNSQSIVRR